MELGLAPGLFAESPRSARRAVLGSTAGVREMELAGLEPATSWVRSSADGEPGDDEGGDSAL